MRNRILKRIREHRHVLLVVPLVIIVMTWPTFARVFDSDEMWFPTAHVDGLSRIWDAWHIERVLAGEAELFYVDTLFHPQGTSLAFQHISLPFTLLYIAFEKLLPADSAYNLLFLLTLCFNAFSAYVLILHLLDEKWSALFGAIVVGVSLPFLGGSTTPDLIMIGTIPITVYFFYRHVVEKRRIFAALAGFCAGITAFIGVYTFVFILMTIGIFGLYWSASRWKQRDFWRGLLLFLVVCGAISAFRFYPMFADATALKQSFETHLARVKSFEVLQCCALTGNPITGDLHRQLFPAPLDTSNESLGVKINSAYLGYINLCLILVAILHKPLRRRIAPWLAVLICFALLRLGHFLTFNGVLYHDILLPEHFLTQWFPAIFGNIYNQKYYQFGAVLPLAVLASFGLARLIESKPTMMRAALALLAMLILLAEFFVPLPGKTIERDKIAYEDWLSSEADSSIKLINLPWSIKNAGYYMLLQTMNDYPIAFGHIHRNPESPKAYIRSNALLNAWDRSRSIHCLPHNERAYLSALEQLLADGFTHIVLHNWLQGDQFINHSFRNLPASYDDGFVKVYRLRDMHLSCQRLPLAPPQFGHLAASSSTIPGARSSVLSFHPNEAIDGKQFNYLASLFSDWQGLLHLYLEDGEPVLQSAGKSYPDLASFARANQAIQLVYNSRDTDQATLRRHISFKRFDLCGRETHEDGSVIERYLSREFTCAILASGQPLQVVYDNGAKLENAVVAIAEDRLDLQIMWSRLPSEPHSLSLQLFNAAGAKALAQDFVIDHASLARHHLDLSALPPGTYAVKLIVYEYASGRSIPGTLSGSGARFPRELQLAAFDRP